MVVMDIPDIAGVVTTMDMTVATDVMIITTITYGTD